MPIYNGIEFIDDSITSILNQIYDKWELLIGINGHIENSNIYKKAKEYELKSDKIKVYDFYTIRGKSNTLNEMVKLVKYNYIALLDVDDIWHKSKLDIQSRLLDKYDVIGSQCIYFGDSNIIPPIPIGNISRYNFYNGNPIINSSCIIKKSLAIWENISLEEDYHLWLDLKKKGKQFYNCHEILVKHRIHSKSAFNAQGNSIYKKNNKNIKKTSLHIFKFL